MKVRVPMMIQDPLTARIKDIKPIEGFDITREDFFLDGPVTKKVAVLDFDPDTNALLPGARFLPPSEGRKLGRYEIKDENDYYARDLMQVSVFATVLKTIYMFEEEDTLGRPLVWAFDAPQLLVVPKAGQWANAYYQRESHSIQFFYFPAHGSNVYTSLSRDIVAHETGHAILDGIAPDLYNAITPQSLALHEAIADLTALLMAFRSHTLRKAVLDFTEGLITNTTAFTSIAEEFGDSLNPDRRTPYLRSLLNEKNLCPDSPECVAQDEPHELSEVLSGALYKIVVNIHEKLKPQIAQKRNCTEFSASGEALHHAANILKRMIYRALDYLPPGEVSFADYGRAIIAADQASHPLDEEEREWIREEFVSRCIVSAKEDLNVKTNFDHPALEDLDLQTFVESDWAAYAFANKNRDLLLAPNDVPLRVRPRLDVTKLYYHRDGEKSVRECIFKVSWDQEESNDLGYGFPKKRQITVGTTLAIDWDTKKVRALLTSDRSNRPKEGEAQKEARDFMLNKMVEKGLLQPVYKAIGMDEKPLVSVVRAELLGDLMRIRGSACMLHIAGGI